MRRYIMKEKRKRGDENGNHYNLRSQNNRINYQNHDSDNNQRYG